MWLLREALQSYVEITALADMLGGHIMQMPTNTEYLGPFPEIKKATRLSQNILAYSRIKGGSKIQGIL